MQRLENSTANRRGVWVVLGARTRARSLHTSISVSGLCSRSTGGSARGQAPVERARRDGWSSRGRPGPDPTNTFRGWVALSAFLLRVRACAREDELGLSRPGLRKRPRAPNTFFRGRGGVADPQARPASRGRARDRKWWAFLTRPTTGLRRIGRRRPSPTHQFRGKHYLPPNLKPDWTGLGLASLPAGEPANACPPPRGLWISTTFGEHVGQRQPHA